MIQRLSLCVIVCLLALITAKRTEVWRTAESLWRDAASKSRSPRPHINYGLELMKRGAVDEAVTEFVKAREGIDTLRGSQMTQSLAAIDSNLSMAFLSQNRIAEAIIMADEALGIIPHYPQALVNRGTARLVMGDCYGATVDYMAAHIHGEMPRCR